MLFGGNFAPPIVSKCTSCLLIPWLAGHTLYSLVSVATTSGPPKGGLLMEVVYKDITKVVFKERWSLNRVRDGLFTEGQNQWYEHHRDSHITKVVLMISEYKFHSMYHWKLS